MKKKLYLNIAIIAIIVIIVIGIFFITKNNDETKKETKSSKQNYTAGEIAEKIKEKNNNVGRIVVYNEETDLNNLLGRPNQYISKATFEDYRVEQTSKNLDPEEFSQEEINEPEGGTIEVFKSKKDMKKRKEYIEEITSSMSILTEYSYNEDVYLLRLNKSLTPSEAKEYEKIFLEIVK